LHFQWSVADKLSALRHTFPAGHVLLTRTNPTRSAARQSAR